jgi:hypothetical protein
MKIALLGGTGHIGAGLAFRLKLAGYHVIVGSRKLEKALGKAEEYNKIVEARGGKADIEGMENGDAARHADIAILTIPWDKAFVTAESLKDELKSKVVVSPVVPMKKENGRFVYTPPPEGSAAEKIASIIDARVVAAFNNIPAAKFADPNAEFQWDVAVCSDDVEAKKMVMDIINSIEGLRGLDAGPLSAARTVEAITPLLINLALKNGMRDLGVKFV